MILDATRLSHLDLCRRRTAIETTHHASQWRAKTLVESQLREGIQLLSSGVEISQVVSEVRARFLGYCANPGIALPSGSNPFIIAKDWAMLLEIVLRSVARESLPKLGSLPMIHISDSASWRVLSSMDDVQTLHRWIICDRWDDDELSRQAHSWYTFGDMAVTRRGMTLHVVEAGSIQSGRRNSCWTRGYRYKHGQNLPLIVDRPTTKSTEVIVEYLADRRDYDPEKWVDTLIKSGQIQKHLHHVTFAPPPEDICEDTLRQIRQQAEEIRAIEGGISSGVWKWSDLPMSRSACDAMVPCPFQEACYRWPHTTLDDAGYVRNEKERDVTRKIGKARSDVAPAQNPPSMDLEDSQ